jgi:AraC family transcriptional regulator of adaptative response / methylphosphotriester-DNA alkyltransferase methyltransferase
MSSIKKSSRIVCDLTILNVEILLLYLILLLTTNKWFILLVKGRRGRVCSDLLDIIYKAVLTHDPKFDGVYCIGIRSTGIFCRPSCRSRTPKRENVRVFDSIQSAKDAGFRACKRCKPEDPGPYGPDAQMVEGVKDLIRKNYDKPLGLAELAVQLNISPYHLHRIFKRVTGETPAQYLRQIRMEQAKRILKHTQHPIHEIAKNVGFRSISHFVSAFQKATGLTPSEYREEL